VPVCEFIGLGLASMARSANLTPAARRGTGTPI